MGCSRQHVGARIGIGVTNNIVILTLSIYNEAVIGIGVGVCSCLVYSRPATSNPTTEHATRQTARNLSLRAAPGETTYVGECFVCLPL